MIMLLGFKNYDGEPHEFTFTREDAMRVAKLAGMRTRINAVAFVTIFPQGIDNGDPTGYINGAEGAIPDTSETARQFSLLDPEDGR